MAADANSSASRGWWRTWVIGRNPALTLGRIFVLVAVVFLVREFVLLPIRVEGPSMEPTFHDGSINFVNRLAYLRSEPRRGDVVAIRLSNPSLLPPHIMYMKRVVGLPGETVAFHDGHVIINGKILDEPYLTCRWNWEMPAVTLGPDQFYLVGDNRTMPEIYHVEGRARRDHIVGKILLCKSWFASSSSLP